MSALGHVRTSCRFIGSPRRCRCSYRRRPRCRARDLRTRDAAAATQYFEAPVSAHSETPDKFYEIVCAASSLGEIFHHKLLNLQLLRAPSDLARGAQQTPRPPNQDHDHDGVDDEGTELRHVIFAGNISDTEQD